MKDYAANSKVDRVEKIYIYIVLYTYIYRYIVFQDKVLLNTIDSE